VYLCVLYICQQQDDHDYGANNQGNDYSCPLASQNEFVTHFSIPASDPRHESQGKHYSIMTSHSFHHYFSPFHKMIEVIDK
jgi:hypothetical protein